VRELDADGHDTTFSANWLLVMMANLNQMENDGELNRMDRRRQRIAHELSVSQRELAT
jgi:hypothetical protein